MWGECVDAVIFDAIVWPRAAAAAEQVRFVPPAQMFVASGWANIGDWCGEVTLRNRSGVILGEAGNW